MIFKEIDRSLSKIAQGIFNKSTLPIYCYIAEENDLLIERINIVLSQCNSSVIELSINEHKLISIDKNIACFLSDNKDEAIIIYLSPEFDTCGDFKVKEHNYKKNLDYCYKNGIFRMSITESLDKIDFAQIIDLYYVKSDKPIDVDNLIECYFM